MNQLTWSILSRHDDIGDDVEESIEITTYVGCGMRDAGGP